MALIAATRVVLDEYRAHLPLTLRQVFYRLVATGLLDRKTDSEYQRLGDTLNRARRAGLIPFAALRDDGVSRAGGDAFENREAVIEYLRRFAAGARLDRQDGQTERLQIWAESAGMVPQLDRIAAPYGVPVLSSGGFDSVTVKHSMAVALADRPATILHVGDCDPSGIHIFSSMAEDIAAFVQGLNPERRDSGIRFIRLAVTPEQAREFGLPSAPPKATDRRRFDGNQTWQCEALPPDLLAAIVRQAIESRLDFPTLDAVLAAENALHVELSQRLNLDGAP